MRKFLWSFFEVFESIAIAVVAVFFIRSFIAQPFLVSGSSMEPNFQDGNYLLVDEITYRFRSPQRGETIVFKYPGDRQSYYIKRVIGLPGEKIKAAGGKIFAYAQDGAAIALDETYVARGSAVGDFERMLGPQEYFVLGDNRNFSFDSRSWGPLQKADIIGIARLRLWPVSSAQAFEAPAY